MSALEQLFRALESAPFGHDFFMLLREVENATPELPRLGRAQRPSQERVRLGQVAEVDFAPASLAGFERGGPAPRVIVRLFGLLGPQGPLPLHLTEYVRERLRQHSDPTPGRFLDVFHHRLLSLFYRAWADAQPTVQHDRPADDRYAAWLGSAAGLDGVVHHALPRAALLSQTGLLSMRSRHPEGLQKVLSHYFGVPVAVQQHVARWMTIEVRERSRLPQARLGVDATLGTRAWDRQSKFRIVVGPLTLEQYQGFLPGGDAWRALREWVAIYVGPYRAWDVELRLARQHVGPARPGRQSRLGLTSWLGHRAGDRDRADLRLRPGSSFILSRPGAHHG